MCIAVLGVSCNGPTQLNSASDSFRIAEFLRENHKVIDEGKLRAIMVVTEKGCLPCNRAFADLVSEHLHDPRVLFWVSAMGQKVDISPFKASPERVVWDYDDRLRATGILEGSGAILLSNGELDTIIRIEARNIEPALAFISNLLELGPSDSLEREVPHL